MSHDVVVRVFVHGQIHNTQGKRLPNEHTFNSLLPLEQIIFLVEGGAEISFIHL